MRSMADPGRCTLVWKIKKRKKEKKKDQEIRDATDHCDRLYKEK